MRAQRVLRWLLLPGVVIHEVAHALVVFLLPNVRVTAIDLTSHVRHEGRYSILGSALISYAPLFVNTAVALWALFYVSGLELSSVESVAIAAGASYVAFAAGMAAIPSWTDVTNPLALSWRRLFSLRGLLVLPFVVVLLVVSIPWLIIAYAQQKSFTLYVLTSVVYAAAIALVAFGIVPLPSSSDIVRILREAFRMLPNSYK